MKVWVLYFHSYDEHIMSLGVFSSKEKARAYLSIVAESYDMDDAVFDKISGKQDHISWEVHEEHVPEGSDKAWIVRSNDKGTGGLFYCATETIAKEMFKILYEERFGKGEFSEDGCSSVDDMDYFSDADDWCDVVGLKVDAMPLDLGD